MTKHFEKEIERLKKKILSLSALVEESVWKAVKSIEDRDIGLASKVIAADHEVDTMEVEVEEECLKVLALHQPVAADLRFVVAVIKMNSDLERIGDLAVNIAEQAIPLASRPERNDIPFDLPGMSEKVQSMLRRALDSLVNLNAKLALQVCAADDEVDAIHRGMYGKVQDAIRKRPEHLEQFIHFLAVSRHLERIADHATNIAEDVIYMTEGQIVRHRAEGYKVGSPSN